MKRYIGSKIINAQPMTRLEYNQFRGWELPADERGDDEGFLVEYVDGGKANTEQYAGYVSWSPKDVFERAYRPLSGGVKSHVCGVTCHPGSATCNGYCGDQRVAAPATYELGTLPFGMAVELLKLGKKVAREGWNGRGMWLALSPGAQALPAEKFWAGPNREFAEQNGGSATVRPYVTMKTADGEIAAWTASQSDVLADDWYEVS